MNLRKTTSTSLNLKFFLKSTRPSLPLKKAPPLFPSPFFSWRRLAALGNMKANFHCAHLHNLSPQGTGDVPTALLGAFFSKTYPSFLTLKEGSTSLSKPLPSQKGKDGANRPTRCSNRFAIWLADHQRSTPAAELRIFVRGWTRFHSRI